MDAARAKELLLLHSTGHPDIRHATWAGGFLGSLRPYSGLRERNFHEVMAAVVALAPELRRERVDREVVAPLWALCFYARLWGVDPDGMLSHNNLISPEDTARLGGWVRAIEWAVAMLLHADGEDMDAALEEYRRISGRSHPPEPEPWPPPSAG
jgi:hypothetical protein